MKCDFDSDQPKLYSIYAYRELLSYDQPIPKNPQLRVYRAGHQITPAMEENAINWFCKH